MTQIYSDLCYLTSTSTPPTTQSRLHILHTDAVGLVVVLWFMWGLEKGGGSPIGGSSVCLSGNVLSLTN